MKIRYIENNDIVVEIDEREICLFLELRSAVGLNMKREKVSARTNISIEEQSKLTKKLLNIINEYNIER